MLPGKDNPSTWAKAAGNVNRGMDLVPAIITAVFKDWPCRTGVFPCSPDGKWMCDQCIAYNETAPEVAMLNKFREVIGTKVIGSWKEPIPDGWCNNYTREVAVAVLINIGGSV